MSEENRDQVRARDPVEVTPGGQTPGDPQAPAPERDADDHLFVVGVGSSAGGLDALTLMMQNLGEPSPDFCIVVCQHVSPDFRSRLTELLQHVTEWSVVIATNGAKLEGGHVYVTPPNHHLELTGYRIDLKAYRGEKPVPSVDRFFASLARQIQSRAIGIVLSGTGSDGAEGMRAINAHNGCTLVQEPGDAKHADMPKSVIRVERYDKILLAQDIPREIRQCVSNYALIRKASPHDEAPERLSDEEVDARILELLEGRTGTDFAKYKPTTIFRRIAKRIEALGLDDKREYLAYVKRTPKELNILFETVLIGVTEFFRDRGAYRELETQLRHLVANLDERRVIRAWSVGTASGEEAYSLAILLHEILGGDIDQYDVQIFATDIDERALAAARNGHYPHSALEHLPARYRERYFTREKTHYTVVNRLRSLILFSRHDISVDPPFHRIDVLLCRNVLIYFNAFLQEEVLQVFHRALTPRGLLFLGRSESTSPRNDAFQRVTDEYKLFRPLPLKSRHDYRVHRAWNRAQIRRAARRDAPAGDAGQQAPRGAALRDGDLRRLVGEALAEHLPHPAVIVSADREVAEVIGSIKLYTELPAGQASLDVTKLIVPELSLELRALLSKVESTGEYAGSYVVRFDNHGASHLVRLHAYPIDGTEQLRYLVTFEPVDPEQVVSDKTVEGRERLPGHDELRALERELATTKEHLALFTEELETSNEELQTLNEELQSANEELKSSNEELETSNEELQSTNEELYTANQELRTTNDRLAEKEEQLQRAQHTLSVSLHRYETLARNFPNGIIATINRAREFTFIEGKILERFGLSSEMLTGTQATGLLDERAAAAFGGIIDEAFAGESGTCVLTFRDRHITLTSIPLAVGDGPGEVESVLVTSQDITDLQTIQKSLATTNRELEATVAREQAALQAANFQRQTLQDLFESAPAFIVVAEGPSLLCSYANPLSSADQSASDYVGKTLFEAVPELAEPDVALHVRRVFESGRTEQIKLLRVSFPGTSGGTHPVGYFDVSIIPRRDTEGGVDGLIVFATDVTELASAKQLIEASANRMREIVDSLPVMAWTATREGAIDFFNERWYAYTGQDATQASNANFERAAHPDDLASGIERRSMALREGRPVEYEVRIRSTEGPYRWHLLRVVPVPEDDGQVSYWIATVLDVHEQKLLALRKDEFMNIASHELRTPLTALRGYHELLQEDGAVGSEMGRAALERMGNSIRRMNRLVGELLDVSRIESGNYQLDLRRHDVKHAVEQAVSELAADTSRVRLEAAQSLYVDADLDRLVQAIENLVSNALKFSPEGSEVVVAAHDGAGRAYIDIRDEGPGISELDQAQIFQRYFRTDGNPGTDGLGLGLYITRQIVEAHGGTLEVDSSPGRGSKFSITLPLADE